MFVALLAGCSGAHTRDGDGASASGASASASPAVAAPSGTPFAVMTPTATSRPAVAAAAHPSPPVAASSLPPAASPASPAAVTPGSSPSAGAGAGAVAVAGAGASPGPLPPRILSVRTSPAVVHDGDTLVWNVRTTPDVVDVVAHVAVYAFRLQKRAVGQYLLSFTIPHGVPGFFHGSYTLDLEARSASGGAASTKVPVTFQ